MTWSLLSTYLNRGNDYDPLYFNDRDGDFCLRLQSDYNLDYRNLLSAQNIFGKNKKIIDNRYLLYLVLWLTDKLLKKDNLKKLHTNSK